MFYEERITKVCGKWNGIYEWGMGFYSYECRKEWVNFWNNWKEYSKKNRITHWHCSIVDENLYLFNMHGSIYVHPMNFTAILSNMTSNNSLDYELKELEKICTDVAEQCGGSYEQKHETEEISFGLCMGNFESF